MKIKALSLILIATLLISCGDSDDAPAACNDVAFGTAFTIEEGGTYCFPDERELRVLSFDNQFCPCNVVCVWEGQMVVSMEWVDGANVEAFEYKSSETFPSMNIPDGIRISDEDEDIKFEEPCSDSNPSPAIVSAIITVSN